MPDAKDRSAEFRLDTPSGSSFVAPAPFKKSVGSDLLPIGLSYPLRFQLAVQAGFEAIEMEAVADRDEAEEVREAAQHAGLTIHSVLTLDNWRYPPSSADRDDIEKCIRVLQAAMANAKLWGADTLLLIPAVVDAGTSYREAYTRSQAVIRSELLPVAQELGVVLAVENVWNGFLLSPLEYERYIDEFESPWVRAYLDVGNMIFGHPAHWVGIAGSRIVKVHVKDFRLDRARRRFSFGRIGEGDIDWPAVRSALLEVGFSGHVTSTGIPRDRWIQQMDRGVRFLRRRPLGAVPGASGLVRALSAVRRRSDILFLHDTARRFDQFRDGRLH